MGSWLPAILCAAGGAAIGGLLIQGGIIGTLFGGAVGGLGLCPLGTRFFQPAEAASPTPSGQQAVAGGLAQQPALAYSPAPNHGLGGMHTAGHASGTQRT